MSDYAIHGILLNYGNPYKFFQFNARERRFCFMKIATGETGLKI